jgi:hypothetical protein
MDSSDRVNQQELLSQITMSYREIFRDYRDQFGILDSQLWFEDMQVDYVLEVILANFTIVNLICERAREELLVPLDSDDDIESEVMIDYDMGYKLSEDCTEITSFAKNEGIEVRNSLIDELFYAHIQYFNISNTGGRFGWFDVNKRLLSSIVRLIQLKPDLEELVYEWQQGIEDLDLEYSDLEEAPPQLRWKKQFIDSILEYVNN